MQFTLGKMFLAVAMLAQACAGMMYRTGLWVSLIVSATMLLFFLVAMIATQTSASKHRAAIWFVSAGMFYLLLTTSSLFADYGRYVVTNYPLAALVKVLRPGYAESYPLESIVKINSREVDFNENARPIFLIGHCVFSWLFAVLTAWFAGRMYYKRMEPKPLKLPRWLGVPARVPVSMPSVPIE